MAIERKAPKLGALLSALLLQETTNAIWWYDFRFNIPRGTWGVVSDLGFLPRLQRKFEPKIMGVYNCDLNNVPKLTV